MISNLNCDSRLYLARKVGRQSQHARRSTIDEAPSRISRAEVSGRNSMHNKYLGYMWSGRACHEGPCSYGAPLHIVDKFYWSLRIRPRHLHMLPNDMTAGICQQGRLAYSAWLETSWKVLKLGRRSHHLASGRFLSRLPAPNLPLECSCSKAPLPAALVLAACHLGAASCLA
jgi:hypothetical protein